MPENRLPESYGVDDQEIPTESADDWPIRSVTHDRKPRAPGAPGWNVS